MIEEIYNFFNNKKILILGFGREGKSTFEFIRSKLPNVQITILDFNKIENTFGENTNVICDNVYDKYFDSFDVIVKSPGVSIKREVYNKYSEKIVSQLSLFLKYTNNIVIGITGSKGKSTTSELIYHILKNTYKNVKLVGNIGIPVFSEINEIDKDTILICEMSSHQLQFVNASPKIAVLLNIFEEHLDYYESFAEYIYAKENIYRYQKENDILIYNAFNPNINLNEVMKSKGLKVPVFNETKDETLENSVILSDSKIIFNNKEENIINVKDIKTKLLGTHNLFNIAVAIQVCLSLDIKISDILKEIESFNGLEHRLEYVGKYKYINFYNDSIATIPEAAICAVKSFAKVDTIIIGGKDRGVNYKILEDFLINSNIENIIFIAESGSKIYNNIVDKKSGCIYLENLEKAVEYAFEKTKKEGICLLSPAAASYGYYKNFEERGNVYKDLIKKS